MPSNTNTNSHRNYVIRPEKSGDAAGVEVLIWDVFGPGMTARAAYVLRESLPFEPALAFVAQAEDGRLLGSVRITKVLWGDTPTWMLGPLGVARKSAGCGIGSALMRTVMAACEQLVESTSINSVILVGDLAYYQPFGFHPVQPGHAVLPRPADPTRILVCPLKGGKTDEFSGPVTRFETS